MKHEPIGDHAERRRILALIERCEKEQTMSRYVDIEKLEPRQFENSEVELGILAYEYDIVQGEPYIDIVCCEECIHCADDYIDVGMGTMPQFTCELGRCGESVQPNDFCSYGERNSSEKPNNLSEIPTGSERSSECI